MHTYAFTPARFLQAERVVSAKFQQYMLRRNFAASLALSHGPPGRLELSVRPTNQQEAPSSLMQLSGGYWREGPAGRAAHGGPGGIVGSWAVAAWRSFLVRAIARNTGMHGHLLVACTAAT